MKQSEIKVAFARKESGNANLFVIATFAIYHRDANDRKKKRSGIEKEYNLDKLNYI